MPRLYDFDASSERKQKAYQDGHAHAYLDDERKGNGEIDLEELTGPHGMLFMDSEFHQFSWNSGKTVRTNFKANELFDWLSTQTIDRWHWLETTSNHGRSTSVSIWIKDVGDGDAFAAAFPGVIEADVDKHVHNLELRRRSAETGLHPGLTAMSLAKMIEVDDKKTRAFIAKSSVAPGFPKLFCQSIGELRTRWTGSDEDLMDVVGVAMKDAMSSESNARIVARLEQLPTPWTTQFVERLTSRPFHPI